MMTFGWRPSDSCYQSAAQKQAAQNSACPSATWFYLLLGLAALMGVSKK